MEGRGPYMYRLKRLGTQLLSGSAHASVTAVAERTTEEYGGRFPSAAQRVHYEEHGFVVVDDAVDPALVPQLLAAVRRTRDRVHDGSLSHGFIHRTGRRTPSLEKPDPWGDPPPQCSSLVLPRRWQHISACAPARTQYRYWS